MEYLRSEVKCYLRMKVKAKIAAGWPTTQKNKKRKPQVLFRLVLPVFRGFAASTIRVPPEPVGEFWHQIPSPRHLLTQQHVDDSRET